VRLGVGVPLRGADVDDDQRLGPDLAAHCDKLIGAEAVDVEIVPELARCDAAFVLRADAVLPAIRRREAPARPADDRRLDPGNRAKQVGPEAAGLLPHPRHQADLVDGYIRPARRGDLKRGVGIRDLRAKLELQPAPTVARRREFAPGDGLVTCEQSYYQPAPHRTARPERAGVCPAGADAESALLQAGLAFAGVNRDTGVAVQGIVGLDAYGPRTEHAPVPGAEGLFQRGGQPLKQHAAVK